MKDYTQYSSRIPSPNFKRSSPASVGKVKSTTTRNVTSHPLSSSPDKREKESESPTGNSQASTPRQPPGSATSGGASAASGPDGGGSHPSTPRAGSSTISPSPQQQKYSPSEANGNDHTTTIQRLQEQLQDALARDNTAKAALAKSDAVILDLRSNQRQLKKQLELLQKEKAEWNKNLQVAKLSAKQLNGSSSNNSSNDPASQQQQQQQQIESLKAQIQELTHKLQQQQPPNSHYSNNHLSKDAKVGELQIQLDRAHAQILTADMVRKELEDTLEAEQYTWELRVQDQEREIVSLQQECETLAQDLDTCRSQWKEAERGWNEELEELREQLVQAQSRLRAATNQQETNHDDNNNNNASLMQKIHQLETERAELQSCLDEALKELEAVDAELQTEDGEKQPQNGGKKTDLQTIESLQHLLRWIYQEGPVEKRLNVSELSSQRSAQELVSRIQEALEAWLEATVTMRGQQKQSKDRSGVSENSNNHDESTDKLKDQLALYQEELKSREESSLELRESLKEAVALLKPLQDAVAQAEEEKSGLQQQLKDLQQDRQSSQEEIVQQSRKIQTLEEQVSSLEEQLDEQKRLSRARESLLDAAAATPSPHKARATTPEGEDSLAKIKRAREELRRKRETEGNLQQLLRDAQSRFANLHLQNENVAAKNRELQGQIEKLGADEQDPRNVLAAKLAQREAELQTLREQMMQMQKSMQDPSSSNNAVQNVRTLEEELTKARGQLAQREQAERVLNKSLKDALGLLKPLQMHLEEAEAEKMEISKELRNLRKRFRQLQMGEGDDLSKSTMGGNDVSVELIKIKDELEETVRQLELENSQLHDALEDLTEDGNKHNEAKLRQRLVELNSRYEVTQNKLEDAHVENHALVKALKQKEMEEMKRKSEMMQLHEKLQKTESELNNAKAIAKSALVKVEELTMANIEQLSRESPMDLNLKVGNMSGVSF
jgi:chromosome segregation ATPase